MNIVDAVQIILLSVSILILVYVFIEMNKKVNKTAKANAALKEKIDLILAKLNEKL